MNAHGAMIDRRHCNCRCAAPLKRIGMTVYVIVQLKMTDRAAYDRYQAQFFDVFKKFEGRLLSADESPAVLEGTWDRDKVVLMSFPGETAFKAWANSPEYLEISKDRKAGAQGVVLLAQGLAPGREGSAAQGHQGPKLSPNTNGAGDSYGYGR